MLNIIVIWSISITYAVAQSSGCRPSAKFYHISHGAVSGWVDQAILNGKYKTTYMIRQSIARAQGQPGATLSFGIKNYYIIQTACMGVSPRGVGMSVMLTDAEKQTTQTIGYPMGYNVQPITLISNRGEEVLIECVDSLLFSFNILLKGSSYVIARVRNIRIPLAVIRKSMKETFTLEVDERYEEITPFLIAAALVMDEYTYPATMAQKQKHCNELQKT